MGTPYQDCYDSFLGETDDVKLLFPLSNETEEEFQVRLLGTLEEFFKRAIPKFFGSQTKLTRDDSVSEFENILRPIEIQIIGLLMLKEYYRKQLNFLASLKGSFSDKDFKAHDKSNQMNQYRQLVKEISSDIKDLAIQNSYYGENGGLDVWSDTDG